MPPQQTDTPGSVGSGPQPDFGFMLKQEPKQKPSRLSSLGKPAKLLLGVGVAFVIVIIVAVVLSGGSGGSKQVVGLMAQSQEILRVTKAQEQQFKDVNTMALAATTEATLTSQQNDFSTYLMGAGIKYGPKELALSTNTSTDAELQTAAQNNNLDRAYATYLKNALTVYQNSMNTVFKDTGSASLKTSLESAYASVATLLQSPEFRV